MKPCMQRPWAEVAPEHLGWEAGSQPAQKAHTGSHVAETYYHSLSINEGAGAQRGDVTYLGSQYHCT